MRRQVSVVIHALIGWAICGATVAIGRQLVSMQTTLWIHALVAPLAFGVLTAHHFRRFPGSSPGGTALTMIAIVVALDGLLVAPVVEHSFAMFGSVLGTWIPFASIAASCYLVGRLSVRERGTGKEAAI